MGVFGQDSGEKTLLTGWGPVDVALGGGGLRRATTHEFLTPNIPIAGRASGGHTPPLGVLAHLARRAVTEQPPDGAGAITWIGPAAWPDPQSLVEEGDDNLLRCSLFIDARTIEERVWATDLALRCPGVRAVVADASGLDMGMSRRLQLAAAGGSAIGLLARPERERGAISASMTRWAVGPARTEGRLPRWEIRLLRCKAGASARAEGAWLVEARRGQGIVCVSADMEHRPAPSAQQSQRTGRLRIA